MEDQTIFPAEKAMNSTAAARRKLMMGRIIFLKGWDSKI
jgi:hypothetical protein